MTEANGTQDKEGSAVQASPSESGGWQRPRLSQRSGTSVAAHAGPVPLPQGMAYAQAGSAAVVITAGDHDDLRVGRAIDQPIRLIDAPGPVARQVPP